MEHDVYIEFAILKAIDTPFMVRLEDFRQMFWDIDDEFDVIFKRLIVQPEPGCIKEINFKEGAKPGYYYELTAKGRLRINVIQKQWNKEVKEFLEKEKEIQYSSSRTFWTKIVGWGTILILIGTIWLISIELRKPAEMRPETHSLINAVLDSIKNKGH